MAINNNFIRKALNLFSIRPVNGDNKNPGRIEPDNPILKKGWGKAGLHLPNYNPLMALWNWYLQETLDTSETLQNRKNRYQDIDFAIKANTLINSCYAGRKTVRICHRMDANIREYFISLKKIRVHSRNSMIFSFRRVR